MSPLQFHHTSYRSFSLKTASRRPKSHPKASQATPRSAGHDSEYLVSLIKEENPNRRELFNPSTKPSAIPRHVVEDISHEQSREVLRDSDPAVKPSSSSETTMSPAHTTTYSPSSSKASSPGASSPSSASIKKSKPGSKDVDWADVTDPEERRRIQNRIAQRKFREKARENKEKAEREMRNLEHAGNSYRIPTAEDFMHDSEPSGLPWGSVNFGHIMARGHELEGQRSSGRGTYVGEDPYRNGYYSLGYGNGIPQTASYGSSGTEDAYLEESNYVYSPVLQTYTAPMGPHR